MNIIHFISCQKGAFLSDKKESILKADADTDLKNAAIVAIENAMADLGDIVFAPYYVKFFVSGQYVIFFDEGQAQEYLERLDAHVYAQTGVMQATAEVIKFEDYIK